MPNKRINSTFLTIFYDSQEYSTISKQLFKKHFAVINNQILTSPRSSQDVPSNEELKAQKDAPFTIISSGVRIFPAKIIKNYIITTQILLLSQDPQCQEGIIKSSVSLLLSALQAIAQEHYIRALNEDELAQLETSITKSIRWNYEEKRIRELIVNIASIDVHRLQTRGAVTRAIQQNKSILKALTTAPEYDKHLQVNQQHGTIGLTDIKKGANIFLASLELDATIAEQANANLEKAWQQLKKQQFHLFKSITKASLIPLITFIILTMLSTLLAPIIGNSISLLITAVSGFTTLQYSQYNRKANPITYADFTRKRDKLIQQINDNIYLEKIKIRYLDEARTEVIFAPSQIQNQSSQTATPSTHQPFSIDHNRPSHTRTNKKPSNKKDTTKVDNRALTSNTQPTKLPRVVIWDKADYPTYRPNDNNNSVKPIANTGFRLFSYIPPSVKENIDDVKLVKIAEEKQTQFGKDKGDQGLVKATGYYTNENGDLVEADCKLKLLGADGKYHLRIYGHQYAKGDQQETGIKLNGLRLTH